MADYFIVLDAKLFHEQIRPALADAWRNRELSCCQSLCASLSTAAQEYARQYHTGPAEELLVCKCAEGALSFDKPVWRALVGEVLLFAARSIPEFPTDLDSLVCLLAHEQYRDREDRREAFAPIQQALRGSRDLTFGGAVYRPEHAGYNDVEDVARLAGYLGGQDPEAWTPADLEALALIEGEEDLKEELDFARSWFRDLATFYQDCEKADTVVVIERMF